MGAGLPAEGGVEGVALVADGRERAVAEAVVAAGEGDDAVATRRDPGGLEGRLDGVRAAAPEDGAVQAGAVREALQQADALGIGVGVPHGVHQPVELGGDGAGDGGVAVPRAGHAEARGEVDEAVPVRVDHVGAAGLRQTMGSSSEAPRALARRARRAVMAGHPRWASRSTQAREAGPGTGAMRWGSWSPGSPSGPWRVAGVYPAAAGCPAARAVPQATGPAA